jgi:uncharacterized protein with HEPN domain
VSPVGRGVANYLRDVIEAIDRIAAYTHAQDFEAFGESRITQDAVARNFEVIGEALRQLSQRHPDYATAHPELPITAAAGMRNVIAHGYWTVTVRTMWDTIRQQLPGLRATVAGLLIQEGQAKS